MKYYLFVAIIIDLLIGDPRYIPHPVVIIGALISWLEDIFIKIASSDKEKLITGILLSLIVSSLSYLTIFYLIKFAYILNYYVGIFFEIILLTTTIAIKSLADAGNKVYNYLLKGDINSARRAVGEIVGRDTDRMEENEIVRASIETIAENTSDGIIAPVFYYLLGGVPLAMTYKAINTMDSMLGYRNERYLFFGRASARLDDIFNFIPARLTGILLIIAALFVGKDWKNAFKIMLRDARKHPSPNGGYTEASVAGALGVRLGGVNYYQGKKNSRAYMGDDIQGLKRDDIKTVISLMYISIIIMLFISFLLLR
jgi:adenosylcobinamide-phosphate synthase